MHTLDGWVVKAPATPQENSEMANRLAEQAAKGSSHSFRECPGEDEELYAINHTVWNLPLSQQGLEDLQDGSLKSSTDCGIMLFIMRVIQDVGCHVVQESGLKGMTPFYSGTQGEDFLELKNELLGECKTIGSWVAPGTEPVYTLSALDVQSTQKIHGESTTILMDSASGLKENAAPLLAVSSSIVHTDRKVKLNNSGKSLGNLSVSLTEPQKQGNDKLKRSTVSSQLTSEDAKYEGRKLREPEKKVTNTMETGSKSTNAEKEKEHKTKKKKEAKNTEKDKEQKSAATHAANQKRKAKDSKKDSSKKAHQRHKPAQKKSTKEHRNQHRGKAEEKKSRAKAGWLCRNVGIFCS